MAMYCLMKGLVSMGIETITVGSTEVNWYDDFVLEILGDPAVPDPWPLPSARWTNGTYLSSIFALLTLEKITPVPFIHVNIDVKPTSCPNPLNVKGNGVLPVAILGSDDFDVNDIDVSLVRLAGVAPLRSSIEDVAAPVVDPEECECTTAGADEFYDLTLKFDKQSIVDALDPFVDGEEVTLEITGELLDGTPFIGSDCIIIKAKK